MQSWEIIARAWAPYVGAAIAEERARNAAMAMMGLSQPTVDVVAPMLMRRLLAASLPCYGGVVVAPADADAAVHDAVAALLAARVVVNWAGEPVAWPRDDSVCFDV